MVRPLKVSSTAVTSLSRHCFEGAGDFKKRCPAINRRDLKVLIFSTRVLAAKSRRRQIIYYDILNHVMAFYGPLPFRKPDNSQQLPGVTLVCCL